MDELNTFAILSVMRIEVHEKNNSVFPALKTYKEDQCVICFENNPNILFCNCGHLCLCEPCYNNFVMNEGNLSCPKCREINKIIRKI